ncbi:MAG: DUF3467 domain-containing protein [Candidatus Binatia bacterium]
MALKLRFSARMRQPGKRSPKSEPMEGRYSNAFQVGHNAFEFVIDLGQFYVQQGRKPRFHTRIVTSPVYAKAFLHVLQSSIEQYEQTYGVIESDAE